MKPPHPGPLHTRTVAHSAPPSPTQALPHVCSAFGPVVLCCGCMAPPSPSPSLSIPLPFTWLCVPTRYAALEGQLVTIATSPTNRRWITECYGQVSAGSAPLLAQREGGGTATRRGAVGPGWPHLYEVMHSTHIL